LDDLGIAGLFGFLPGVLKPYRAEQVDEVGPEPADDSPSEFVESSAPIMDVLKCARRHLC